LGFKRATKGCTIRKAIK